jgi:prevent-host-death family protein
MCYLCPVSDTSAGRGPARPTTRTPRAGQRIGIRELRQHASVYVDLAEKGVIVDITNRGRLVARLVPVREPESTLARLVAAGVILPAEEPGNLLAIEPAPPVAPGQPTASEILTQMREEERY